MLLIVTDDQGYADLSLHGNPRLATPNLDRLGRFDSFYVSPVCPPTRASLLTGRSNYRTGVVDTYLGRSLMHADETTLAEMLSGAGYRTGIFGKWRTSSACSSVTRTLGAEQPPERRPAPMRRPPGPAAACGRVYLMNSISR